MCPDGFPDRTGLEEVIDREENLGSSCSRPRWQFSMQDLSSTGGAACYDSIGGWSGILYLEGAEMIAEGKLTDIIAVLEWVAKRVDVHVGLVAEDKQAPALAQSHNAFSEVAGLARQEAKNLSQPFRLGVVGMFKSGKSTVLNTLLGRQLLKVGRTEATSVLTEMRYAESADEEAGEIYYAGGRVVQMSVADALEFTDIRSDTFRSLSESEQRNKQRSIDRIVLHVHADLLRNLVLLDTPGFGGSEVGDDKALAALENVDAAVMIFSADRTGAEQELRVAQLLNKRGRELVALLNRVDDNSGGLRSEESLAECEVFISETFRSLAKGADGRALVFRYSAKEIWPLLEQRIEGRLTDESARQLQEGLTKWGYLPTGDGGRNQGFIEFIREHYLSSDAQSVQRKVRTARTALLNGLTGLLDVIDGQRAQLVAEREDVLRRVSGRTQEVENKIEPLVSVVEQKVEDEISTQVEGFCNEVGEAIATLIEDLKDLNVSTVLLALRSKAAFAEKLELDFRRLFPVRRDELLAKNVDHRVRRVLRNEWRSLLSTAQRIEPQLQALSTDGLIDGVADVLRSLAAAIAMAVTGFIALCFIPGGILVDLIVTSLGLLMGIKFGSKVDRKIAIAQSKARQQVRNLRATTFDRLYDSAAAVNTQIADTVRAQLLSGNTEDEQLTRELDSRKQAWDQAANDVARCRNAVDQMASALEAV
jgi:GTPase Era involved in 16S rRNA processing